MELRECLGTIKKHLWLIILILVFASVSAWVVSKYFVQKEYESTSTIILNWPIKRSGSQNALLGSNYIKIYNNLSNSESLYESIIYRLQLNSTVDELKKQIRAVADFDTGIIKISIISENPGLAKAISLAFIECLREQSVKLSLGADIKIIDEPKAPTAPLYPNIILNIILSAVGGIFAGLLTAILLGVKEQSSDELNPQKLHGLRMLGSLHKIRERGVKNDPVIVFRENSSQSEDIKLIRARLKFLLEQNNARTILVTSLNVAEGKTTFAVNIAKSLAQTQKNVLLADFNEHRPALNMIHNLMGYNKESLSLEQKQNCNYQIYKISSLGIDLISKFVDYRNQQEDISSWMNIFLEEMLKKYDYLIFDCSTLSYSGTVMLSVYVKNVIIVTAYGHNDYQKLGRYNRLLSQVGADILGIVVNNAPQVRTNDSNYYKSYDIGPKKSCRNITKRIFDITISLFLMLVTAPLTLIISILVLLTSKGPVIFRHMRVGCGGNEFYLYKFRTMLKDADKMKCNFTAEQQKEFSETYKLRNDPRVTPVGKILRKTSLDELPQLINVLKGDMSIVGPRPITREELSKYNVYSDMLLSVNPGITGLWQVNGRSDTSYEERVRLDMKYVMHHSILIDLKIIFTTFRIIASRMGAF